MKVLSLFSGVGAPEMALRNLNIKYDLVGFSEIDKHAIKSYCAIHGVSEDLNLGDISKIDINILPKDIDLITHGSPCQDFSVAGKGQGGTEGSGTRSSLMWETVKIIRHCKPTVVLWENVKNVVSKKHRPTFDKYLESMENLGYKNYWKVLNAKDYGVPQNRERVFVVSILDNKNFKFIDPIELTSTLKDVLETQVDEKYYINNDKADKLIQELIDKKQLKYEKTPCDSTIMKPKALEISNCITARYDAGIQNKQSIGVAVCEKTVRPIVSPDRLNKKQNGRRLKEENDPMFTLTTQDRHGILEEYKFPTPIKLTTTLKDILEDNVDETYYIDIEKISDLVEKVENFEGNSDVISSDYRYDEGLRIRKNGLCPTLTCKVGSSSLSSNPFIIFKGDECLK